MVSKAPIYRKTCVVCDRPALTLDDSGDAYCGGHTEVFIAIEDTPDGVDEAEIAILLVHRSLVTEVSSFASYEPEQAPHR
jgi:hypothetical protein